MKKRLLALTLAFAMCLAFAACGGEGNTPKDPPDLTGTWKQDGFETAETYQEAIIDGDTITINWVTVEDNSKALYWAGTYIAPNTASDPYTWDSKNDHEQTDSAILASSDDTKTFTYSNGVLSYSVSAMGVTKTVELIKQ